MKLKGTWSFGHGWKRISSCLGALNSFAGDCVESKYCAAERVNKLLRINWNLFPMSRCPPPGWAVWSGGSEGLGLLPVSSGLCPCFHLPLFIQPSVPLDSKRTLVSACPSESFLERQFLSMVCVVWGNMGSEIKQQFFSSVLRTQLPNGCEDCRKGHWCE